MIKKLLLLVTLLATVTVGQVENTSLQWMSYGYTNDGSSNSSNQALFWRGDSLTAVSITTVSKGNAHYLGGGAWDRDLWSSSIREFTWYATNVAGETEYILSDDSTYLYNIQHTSQYTGVFSTSNYTYLLNPSNSVRSGTTNSPTAFNVYGPAGVNLSANKDSIFAYSTSYGYDNDSIITKARLIADGTATSANSWSVLNTNLRLHANYAVFNYSGRWPVYSFTMNGYQYVVQGWYNFIGTSKAANTDTLWIYKAPAPYTNFSYVGEIAFPNNEYGGIHEHHVIGDTIVYLTVLNATASNNGVYSINTSDVITNIEVPTNLYIWGSIATSFNYLVVSVNDMSIGTGQDSAKTYIRDPNGQWSWLRGPKPAANYLTPTAFLEGPNKEILAWRKAIEVPYGTYDADTDMFDYVYRISGFLSLTSPKLNDVFTSEDVPWTWIGDIDTALGYYSIDNGSSWVFIDTMYNSSYTWASGDILAEGINGTVLARLTNLDSSFVSTSGEWTFIGNKSIIILSPIDSTSTMALGDVVNIQVQTILVDTLSLFYAVNDTTSWIPLALDIPTTQSVDTISYNWTLPNIHGTIYLLATENNNADTIDITERTPTFTGVNTPSQPAMCWYSLEENIIESRKYYDQSCGWGVATTFVKVTATIDDFGTGFNYLAEDCLYPGQLACATSNPLYSGAVWLENGVDTTLTRFGEYYTNGDTLVYKYRRYYIGSDSIFYCDDLINNIDSLVIADLRPYKSNFTTFPNTITKYHVQISKILDDTINVSENVELRNDIFFNPIALLVGASPRGLSALAVELLEKPNDANAVSDMVSMFTALDLRRDYFRGIDPKARKSGR